MSQRPEHALEPTLAELLTHFARTTVPRRLYQLLQLGIPFAIDFGLHRRWRLAAWGIALAALGAWGLADRWLWERPTAMVGDAWRPQVVRVGRAAAGVLAAGVIATLLIELFLRMLGNAPIS